MREKVDVILSWVDMGLGLSKGCVGCEIGHMCKQVEMGWTFLRAQFEDKNGKERI